MTDKEKKKDLREQEKLIKVRMNDIKDLASEIAKDSKLKGSIENILKVVIKYKGIANSGLIKQIMIVFECTYSTAYSYLNKAHKEIHRVVSEDKDRQLGEFFARYEKLIEKNENIEDFKEVRAILKDYSELLGLKVQKVEVNSDLASMFSSMDELDGE